MEISIVVIMVLTNLIMLVGGYYLGYANAESKIRKLIENTVTEFSLAKKVKSKYAKPTSRI